MCKEGITQEKFEAYTRVQKKGLYNMLDQRAEEMSGLSTEDYWDIIGNYEKYYHKYKEKKYPY